MVEYWFSSPNQRHLHSPLRSNVHDQDDLSLELVEFVLLVTRELGLEAVELGHRPGKVWRGSGKLAVGVEMKVGRQQSRSDCPQLSRGHQSDKHE